VTVGEVARMLGYPQPTVSLYLQRLADAGLITMTRVKREVYCAPAPSALKAIAAYTRG
jgi:DNA-binding transcriptional ArsR family regulator